MDTGQMRIRIQEVKSSEIKLKIAATYKSENEIKINNKNAVNPQMAKMELAKLFFIPTLEWAQSIRITDPHK